MKEDIHQARKFLKKKNLDEGERIFLNLSNDPNFRRESLLGLARIARMKKDFDRQIVLLKTLLSEFRNDHISRIILLNIQVIKGQIKFDDYKSKVISLLEYLATNKSLNFLIGLRLLRNIHYGFNHEERQSVLKLLLSCIDQSSNFDGNEDKRLLRCLIYLSIESYEQFQVEFSKIKEPTRRNLHRRLKRVNNKLNTENHPDRNEFKIFGIGLSRTGTTSLNDALNILGFNSIHWINNLTQDIIQEKDFFLFDGFTDIPVSYRFEELYQKFPNAMFIFTTRDRNSWVRSIFTHYNIRRGISYPHELANTEISKRFGGIAGDIERNLYSSYSSWEECYDEYHARVDSFFKDKPKSKFLKLKICEGEGWERLCPFVNKEIPNCAFPNSNKGPQ